MFKIIKKTAPALVFWGIFASIVLQVPYPDSLAQGTTLQILPFFISLFLALTLTVNIFLKHPPSSSLISLGIIFLLILKALDTLNIVTASLIIIAVYLFLSYFRKIKRKSLTQLPRIPKLTKRL